MEQTSKFYLGKLFETSKGETTDQQLLYEPDDLNTHAVVVGMTGSGKTGLCIDMLEEAALNNIPALMIDPKGDITNTLLHFPNLEPGDFQPWVNADQARRDGKTVEQAAADTASLWRNGLNKWDISPDRLENLSQAAHFAIYTPGSDAGIPVSILASLKAPPIPWEENREILREKITGTVTAILGLVGMQDVDPVRSREHILLANIFENAWSQGHDLDLSELILQSQNPPFSKLGVFDVDTFFPEKDRFELAMLLNNILAAPAFQTWIEGQPLDVKQLLYAPDGRIRHSVFYIAHLNDQERMFFVTLLYSAIETWMRAQSGTSTLRAIVYFDEIFGYLPPIANPPSKEPMLRMLKQARAFGVGQVLVTQNPVDVDYKALSNAGTWLIGKLQTDQDKQRLLDGLESAVGGGMDRSEYDRLISALGKRVFLSHNVHEKGPRLFQTRWAMNYLAGPLTRTQLPPLNKLVGASLDQGKEVIGAEVVNQPVAERVAGRAEKPLSSPAGDTIQTIGSSTRPAVPSGVAEYFLPNNLTFTQAMKAMGSDYPGEAVSQGLIYRPVLLAQAQVRFLQRKYNLDYELRRTALVEEVDRRGVVRWEDFTAERVDEQGLDEKADPRARFSSLEAPLAEAKTMGALEKDFADWIYHEINVRVRANENLKIYVGPEVSQSEFRQMCSENARKERDAEIEKVSDSFDKKIKGIEEKISREQRELREDETELSQRKMEELGTHAENILSLFGGRRRRLSTSLSKRRMTEKAKADVEESIDALEDYKQQISDLEKEKSDAIEEINRKWSEISDDMTEIPITPYKKDISMELFGVAWMPYHLVQVGEKTEEWPGYGVPN
jgi:hypothetical protein